VVWEDGKMKKADYRKFGIQTIQGANDFGMLYEVVSRHYARVQDKGGPWPDLIVIDGGRGQLNAAIDALRALDITVGNDGATVIGLAKERGEKGERIFRPGAASPIALDPGAAATRLLQRIRDEAHRFAITFHRAVRHRRLAQSRLDAVVGIGPARKKALLARFGSVERLAAATEEDVRSVPGIPGALARLVLHALREADPRRG
jgi:excinuclease ABC subunit C